MGLLSRVPREGWASLWWVPQILIATVLLGLALSFLDWRALHAGITRVSLTSLAVASALSLLTQLCSSARWYVMIRKVVPGSPLWHGRHYYRATFLNLVTPGAVGADIYRVSVLGYGRGASASIIGLLMRERFVGLLGYCLFYLACFGVAVVTASGTESPPPPFFTWVAGAMGCGAVAVAAVLIAGPFLLGLAVAYAPNVWAQRLRALTGTLRWCSPAEFATILGLTVLACGTWTAAAKVFGGDLGVPAPLPVVGMIAVVAEVARLIPTSIQGLGVREGVYAFCAGLLHQSPEAGFLMGALVYLVNSLVLALAGVAAAGGSLRGATPLTSHAGDTA